MNGRTFKLFITALILLELVTLALILF